MVTLPIACIALMFPSRQLDLLAITTPGNKPRGICRYPQQQQLPALVRKGWLKCEHFHKSSPVPGCAFITLRFARFPSLLRKAKGFLREAVCSPCSPTPAGSDGTSSYTGWSLGRTNNLVVARHHTKLVKVAQATSPGCLGMLSMFTYKIPIKHLLLYN